MYVCTYTISQIYKSSMVSKVCTPDSLHALLAPPQSKAAIQSYLLENAPPWDPTVGLCLGSQGGLREVGVF